MTGRILPSPRTAVAGPLGALALLSSVGALATGCTGSPSDSLDSPAFAVTQDAPRDDSVQICVETKNSVDIDVRLELDVRRADAVAEVAVVGLEVINSDINELESTAYTRLSSEISTETAWTLSTGEYCIPYDIRVRLIEGPDEAALEGTWTLSADVVDDDKATVTVETVAGPAAE